MCWQPAREFCNGLQNRCIIYFLVIYDMISIYKKADGARKSLC
jgi:hypothetical protein